MTETALALVAMISRLQDEGATWAQIAIPLGCKSAKEAKARAHKLARQAQQEAVGQMLAGGDSDV